MASREAMARARRLLGRAADCDPGDEDERLRRNLLIAAAMNEVLPVEVVVAGGTAEDFWTADSYHETDVDLVTRSLDNDDKAVLAQLGFLHEGRHWVHQASGVPVEIPEATLKGDVDRIHREDLDPGVVAIIGVEDLYLDRIRQSTMFPEDETLETYKSALAIGAANYDYLDWDYVDNAVDTDGEVSPVLMRMIETRARRAIRRRLSST